MSFKLEFPLLFLKAYPGLSRFIIYKGNPIELIYDVRYSENRLDEPIFLAGPKTAD